LSWDCFVRRVKLRWIAIFVLLLSAASFVIVSGRGAGLGIQIFNFAETGREKLDLLSLFHEQGRSIEVVLRTMEFSEQNGLMYGRTFIDSIVSVVPLPILNLVGYRFVESPATWIVENSPDIGLNEGAGSSLIAELYYNFGMLGCLSFLIIGWYISRAYFKYAFSGNIFTGLNVMTVVALYTVMMRNDSGGCWRLLIYGFIVVALLRRKREDSFMNWQKAKGSKFPEVPVSEASQTFGSSASLDIQA
jgi:O-antigen polysaccharide polymerase Wzy-like protein